MQESNAFWQNYSYDFVWNLSSIYEIVIKLRYVDIE